MQTRAAPPAFAEVFDVAGLETAIVRAPPIDHLHLAFEAIFQPGRHLLLLKGNVVHIGVAEHIKGEPVCFACTYQVRHDGVQIGFQAFCIFVADTGQQRCRASQRLSRVAVLDRADCISRVSGKPHDEEADHRIPETYDGPGQGDHEADKNEKVERRISTRRKRQRHQGGEAGKTEPDKGRERQTPCGHRSN